MVIGGQPIFTSETFQWRVLHTRENLFWTDSQGSLRSPWATRFRPCGAL